MAKRADYPVFEPFNPLDKRHLGASVANALLESDIYPLPPEPFVGAGVYALYYVGDFPAYEALADVNRNNQYGLNDYPIIPTIAHGLNDMQVKLQQNRSNAQPGKLLAGRFATKIG